MLYSLSYYFTLYESVFSSNNNYWEITELLNSLAAHWLGLRAFTAKGTGSIPDWGTKIPQLHGMAKNNNNNKVK